MTDPRARVRSAERVYAGVAAILLLAAPILLVQAVADRLSPARALPAPDAGSTGGADLVGGDTSAVVDARRVVVDTAVASMEAAPDARVLRVCADPNNLPFSNDREEGFENVMARLVARDLGAGVDYLWKPQRRGFVRMTLSAGLCDVMMEAPADFDRVLTTRPYYRSSYVFVTRRASPFRVRSFDDPLLRDLRIGVQVVGDDYANTPPAAALARRGLTGNISGYSLYGDYSVPDPPARIVDAVARGEIDVAVVWGPLAGFFARHQCVPLEVTPVGPPVPAAALSPSAGAALAPFAGERFVFDIAMGVRKGDTELRDRLDRVLRRRRADIEALLDDYAIPRLPLPEPGPAAAD